MGDFAEIVKRLPEGIKVLQNVFLAGRWYPFLLLQKDIGILVVRPIQYRDWQLSTSSSEKVFWSKKDSPYQMSHPASILREQCCYLSYWLQSSDSKWFKKDIPFNTLPPVRGLFFMENIPGDGEIPTEIAEILSRNFTLSYKVDWQRLLDQGGASLLSFILSLPPVVFGAQEILPEDLARWSSRLAEKISDTESQTISPSLRREETRDYQQNFQFDYFSLNGFKVYGKETTLSFTPITVLLGKNNSGKSALIQALLLLKQSLENPGKSAPLTFHGPYWDLGTFEKCCYRNKTENSIQFILAFKNPLGQKRAFGFKFGLIRAEQLALKELAYYEGPTVDEIKQLPPLYIFRWDNQFMGLVLKEVNFEHPLWETRVSDLLRQKEEGKLDPSLSLEDSSLKRLLTEGPTGLFLELRAFLPAGPKTIEPSYWEDPGYSQVYSTFFGGLKKLSDTMDEFFHNIIHIGPNRPCIKRFYSANNLLTEDKRNWEIFYDTLANSAVREKVNKWLKDDFQIDYEVFVLKGTKFGTDIILPRLRPPWKLKNSINNSNEFNESSLDSDDESLLAFCDVGQGITHLFPVIVTLLTAKDSLIIIEEPEVHIHPGLQTCLGDLFRVSAQENHNLILVESHSEYIIDRLQRRIADGGIKDHEEVSLYYLECGKEAGSDAPAIKRLSLDKYGLFQDKIPSDFFNVVIEEGKFQLEEILKRERKK